MDPFYFQIRPKGVWHTAVAAERATREVTGKCGIKTSFDRRNKSYRDMETMPYAAPKCTRCDS